MQLRRKHGYIRVLGYKLFYKSFSGGEKGTLLCLHGGPGMTHDYILPLADLAKAGYRVLFYDQLGCGKSALPKNVTLFTIERAVEEVEAFRRAMKLGMVNLMGSSYGGLLAIAYALKYQKNLRSLITTGGLASVPLTVAEMDRMKRQLPRKVQATLQKYEDQGDFENPEYQKAVMVFYKKHLCRLPKWPNELTYTLDHVSKHVYYTMNGPNELTIIGTCGTGT
jgi:proline iminopeptidase